MLLHYLVHRQIGRAVHHPSFSFLFDKCYYTLFFSILNDSTLALTCLVVNYHTSRILNPNCVEFTVGI